MNFITEGLLQLSGLGIVITTLVLTHITIASVTIFLHRHQSHHSLALHPIASHFFRFWIWLTTGTVTKEWVAIHRKHHVKCETSEDPHSPQILGLKKLLLQGYQLYYNEACNQETLDKYGNGTPDDWLERHLYSRHALLGITIMLCIDILAFGIYGLAVFVVQMVWIPFWAAGIVNGIGHYFGYRNFETPDASRNITPLGILIGGEELHNNHHAYPSSARLSNKWWEIDLGWQYIRMLNMLGLATIKKVAPKLRSEIGKHLIDIDTVRAMARNRFHLIKLYGRKVIKPVIRQECLRANQNLHTLLQNARKFMTREDLTPNAKSLLIIQQAVAQSQTLATVYRFKQQLMDLWLSSRTNQAKRISRMQQWCFDAEQTGITVLQEFAIYLRGYTEVHVASSA